LEGAARRLLRECVNCPRMAAPKGRQSSISIQRRSQPLSNLPRSMYTPRNRNISHWLGKVAIEHGYELMNIERPRDSFNGSFGYQLSYDVA
jgi:hypothetical protein